MNCRFCQAPLTHVFIDLGNSPPSNSFLKTEELNEPEVFYPLKVYTCDKCFLVQVDEFKKSEAIFNNEYVYFSSYSSSWLEHSRKYVEMMLQRFPFNSSSLVIEIASNDGYLLQYFKEKLIPVLGIEPTANTAEEAVRRGVDTLVEFFGSELALQLQRKGYLADLVLGNNVLAHVPDIVDFVTGMKIILKPTGIITMEFPHLMQLVDNRQFDTIYHEHFSYLSLTTVKKIFEAQGLAIFDVEELPTHGGSLRIYARHHTDTTRPVTPAVTALLEKEESKGMNSLPYYNNLQQHALKIKVDLSAFLFELKKRNKKVAAYGAAAKGNTLLNYCGIKADLLPYVVDANPHKQNKWLPGSHIPVVNESFLKADKPNFVVILPWNIKEEIMQQLSYIREWDGQFIIPIPELQLI
jgi:2-polyprenyl-3-methyl-5-hydroxy-6-metoxy-1,4-benzoquinol methylase